MEDLTSKDRNFQIQEGLSVKRFNLLEVTFFQPLHSADRKKVGEWSEMEIWIISALRVGATTLLSSQLSLIPNSSDSLDWLFFSDAYFTSVYPTAMWLQCDRPIKSAEGFYKASDG